MALSTFRKPTLELKAGESAVDYTARIERARIGLSTKGQIDAGLLPEGSPIPSAISNGTRRYTTPTGSTFRGGARAAVSELDITPPTDIEQADIRQRAHSEVQKFIDSIEDVYARAIGREEIRGVGRQGQVRAAAARGGRIGTGIFGAQKEKAGDLTESKIGALEAEKTAKISEILDKAITRADKRIEAERTEALTNRDTRLTFLKEQRDESRDDIASYAKSGTATIDEIPDELYGRWLEQGEFQSEAELNAFFEGNLPTEEKPNYRIDIIREGDDGNAQWYRVDEQGNETTLDLNVPYESVSAAKKEGRVRVVDGKILAEQEDGSWIPVGGRGISIPTKGGENNVFVTDDGEEINITTVAGVKRLVELKYGYSDIFSFIDNETKLTSTAIKNLLAEAGLKGPVQKATSFTEENLKTISIGIVKKTDSLEEAKEFIDQGSIISKGKTYELTQKQIDRIKEIIDEEYPKGRTGPQKFFPGGK